MKKLFRNSLMMLAAGAFAVSCADYNDTYNFTAQPDPSYSQPYAGLDAVKSYIDRNANPNLAIGATLDIKEFNKQELAHAAAMTNFDYLAFGKTLMSGSIISPKGVMNFIALNDLLAHMDEVGGEVFGSPLAANANQADEWIKMLTAPIEIVVDYVPGKIVDYNTYAVGAFDGTVVSGKASIAKYDNQSVLQVGTNAKVRIIEGFEVDPKATYTVVIWAKADKDASFNVEFSGNNIEGTATADGKWAIPAGKWTKVTVECKAAEDATEGYLQINNTRSAAINIQKVEVGYYPDNHRPQTEKEKNDTINYALNAWCDGFMKINQGRIKQFDLIDEAIDNSVVMENGMYDLKHSETSNPFWQDALGSENYGPVVSRVASEAFAKHEGNPEELKFYISEIGLENTKKMESLVYWINLWAGKGAKIDGINAKVNLAFYEDAAKLEENKKAYETLLANLAATGKLIRISNFDIKYYDASGAAVTAANITDDQRQKLADYNAYAIKAYMSKIPQDKQAGICKGNLVDTADPVGLWGIDPVTRKDWIRTATYKAWCDALGGK